MKKCNVLSLGTVAITWTLLCSAFGHAAITIDTVPIGNPGNPGDSRLLASSTGSVSYVFSMGKTEVTNAQYVEFLNAVAASDPYGLYQPNMGTTTWGGIVRSGSPGSYTYSVKPAALNGAYAYGNKPVMYVDSGDAMRFANWLHNGQPTGGENAGTTEDGAYTLNGAISGNVLANVKRNAGARWWLPNGSEWYKAAYHKNDGVTGNYWDFPTRTNADPNNNAPSSDTGNSANYYNIVYTTGDSNYPLTDVGAYTRSSSPYGTFDQGGNVWEWTEESWLNDDNNNYERTLLGSSWAFGSNTVLPPDWALRGQFSTSAPPEASQRPDYGFRVATVPDPSSVTLFGVGALTLLTRRRSRIA